MTMVLPEVDTHQSYDDFRLDALLQYDLDDSERGGRTDNNIDHSTRSSSHSSDLPVANFEDLYASIPDIECDNTTTTNRHSARSTTGRSSTRREKSQRLFNVLSTSTRSVSSDGDVFQKKSQKGGFIRSLRVLMQRSNHEGISSAAMDHGNSKRGVVRKLSSRTEGTVYSCDDKSRTVTAACAAADDDSSSVCYIECDNNSYTLADEWYNCMDRSTDTFESNDFAVHEMSKNDMSKRLYRSLPMIESRGLVSLLLDSDDDTECHTEEHTFDGSEKRRRPYSICDF